MRFIFLATHLNSGYEKMLESISKHPHIHCLPITKIYTHPSQILAIPETKAKIYIGTLLYNYSLASDAFYRDCEFMYLIRGENSRTKRLYKMSQLTPKHIFIDKKETLETFLGVKLGLQNMV